MCRRRSRTASFLTFNRNTARCAMSAPHGSARLRLLLRSHILQDLILLSLRGDKGNVMRTSEWSCALHALTCEMSEADEKRTSRSRTRPAQVQRQRRPQDLLGCPHPRPTVRSKERVCACSVRGARHNVTTKGRSQPSKLSKRDLAYSFRDLCQQGCLAHARPPTERVYAHLYAEFTSLVIPSS